MLVKTAFMLKPLEARRRNTFGYAADGDSVKIVPYTVTYYVSNFHPSITQYSQKLFEQELT